MKSVWQDLPKPFFILAPMEAVTDHIFRRVVAKAAAPDLFFTEFTNATGWVHAGEKAVAGRLIIHPDETYPIIAQLWGSVPEDIAKLAKHCKKLGYKGIDINMGCPDSSAIKSGGGSALIRTPELAAEIIAAAKTAGLPVSVKTRLGYSRPDEWESWLKHILMQDIVALTVHLRTKKEMSKVPAHWELMPAIKKLRDEIAPHTLLIGNGDVQDRAHGTKLAEDSGIDGVMIGRGVFSNIFDFESQPRAHSRGELLEMLHYHLTLFEENEAYKRPFETLKRFFKVYIRDFAGSGSLRAALMTSHSTTEARAILGDAKQREAAPTQMSTKHSEDAKQVTGLGHLRYHIDMHHSIKAIVFDSDGTLVNTKKLIVHGYQTVLKRHGLDHLTTESYIRQRLGKPVPETYEQILAGHHVDVSIDQLVKEHDEVQNENINLIKPYPEAEKLLRQWRKEGIKLCLFTSGNKMMIERNFTAAGIKNPTDLFDAIITADDNIPRKPEPDAIIELLKRVGVEPQNAVVVGDHAYDIQSGTRAHAGLTIGILHGFGESKELLGAGADFLAHDLLSLEHLLQLEQ